MPLITKLAAALFATVLALTVPYLVAASHSVRSPFGTLQDKDTGYCHKIISARVEDQGFMVRVKVKNVCPIPRKVIVCFADPRGANYESRDIGEQPGYACNQGHHVNPGMTSDFTHRYMSPVGEVKYHVFDDLIFSPCLDDPLLEVSVNNSAEPSEDRTVQFAIRNRWDSMVDFKYCLITYGRCVPKTLVTRLKPGDRWIGEVKSGERLSVNCIHTRLYK